MRRPQTNAQDSSLSRQITGSYKNNIKINLIENIHSKIIKYIYTITILDLLLQVVDIRFLHSFLF